MMSNEAQTTGNIAITDNEFTQFQRLIFQLAGISLSNTKKMLLTGRLSKRLHHFGFSTFTQYFRHVTAGHNRKELQTLVDLLTTNETYFFREPAHFDFLGNLARQHRKTGGPARNFRVWSAASSSGEEAYSIAMVLADVLGHGAWEVVGTDISTQVLDRARNGHYPLKRIEGIPQHWLKKYCLKGIGDHEGTLLIAGELRNRVRFMQNNLMTQRDDLGQFDVIFLRNVMIYFDQPTKQKVIANLLPYLKSGGHFIVGHAETLNGLTGELAQLKPTVYSRPKP